MKITSSTLSSYDLSIYHDCEVSQFVVDYANHKIQIPLKHPKTSDVSISFNNVKSLSLNIDEEWGPGIYVYEITANINDNNEGQFLNISILLNSGDVIRIICESIEIEQ